MSYIPKYILKRMLPKDCVKSTDEGLKIQMINVISPITIEEIPDNVLDYLEVVIDGNPVGNDVKEKIEVGFEGEKATFGTLKNYIGRTIPVGGTLDIFIPVKGLKSGEEHEFDITIKSDNPFNIKVKRTIQ